MAPVFRFAKASRNIRKTQRHPAASFPFSIIMQRRSTSCRTLSPSVQSFAAQKPKAASLSCAARFGLLSPHRVNRSACAVWLRLPFAFGAKPFHFQHIALPHGKAGCCMNARFPATSQKVPIWAQQILNIFPKTPF
ncbi:hypothetical protein H9Q10_11795 [Eikenella sp. S3360]|uniref:Uncharacterized protein n=1 Tax=Eikenella glucosivorans TaxID=2766967 RepID=A0ABS0NDG2_9NEIS|nr:hypothetical protein [Eikenella glucosivorans]MBH5330346.1 hypothetical protein [Eikenella glucosivorans]